MAVRILVVDDEALVQTVIAASLTPLGHAITSATDGESALAAALIDPPDLVISDVMMPGMDGWALVRRVRAHPRLAFVPFIFLSALSSVDDVLRGFRLGADDYLPKPFTPEALIERVEQTLERRGRIESSARGLLAAPDLREAASGIRGSLAEIGLSSLLVLLELEKKSGVLELSRSEPPERCRILISAGRVFQAHCDLGPPLSRAAVIYYLLAWSSGAFTFSAEEIGAADEIGCSTTGLLMEAARRADELEGASDDLADLFIDDEDA